MNSKYPCRKLNFNAPLLSIRRIKGGSTDELSCSGSQVVLQNTIDRVPFSWEQSPGKPKDFERGDIHDGDTPRPRLPPRLWQHPPMETTNNEYPHCVDHAVPDVGCDGNGNGDDAAAFSDTMDVVSLTEAIDIATKDEKAVELDGLKLKLAESSGNESPNYIIKRFLPDAIALAATSALSFSKSFNRKLPKQCNYTEACASRTVGQACSPPKGCLYPWRMKHNLCGIRRDSLNLRHHYRPKQKERCCSSANVSSNVHADT